MVQDTNTILEQWRAHYEREIVNLQLEKVELEGTIRQKSSEQADQISAVSAFPNLHPANQPPFKLPLSHSNFCTSLLILTPASASVA